MMTDYSPRFPSADMHKDLYPHDKILAKILLPFIPQSVTPNSVTIVRFILTPFVIILLLKGYTLEALYLFLFTAFTDALDGTLARVRNQVTAWGTIYDPVADKFLIGSCLLLLTLQYLPWYITALIVILEVIFLTGGFIKKKEGIIMSPSWWGKSKMIAQVAGVGVLLLGVVLQSVILIELSWYIFVLAIVLAIINIVRYGIQL